MRTVPRPPKEGDVRKPAPRFRIVGRFGADWTRALRSGLPDARAAGSDSPSLRGPASPCSPAMSTAIARPAIAIAIAIALSGCASFPRRMQYDTVRSAALRDTWADFAVLLPPGFTQDERLPLVVFLHGGGDDEASLDRHGVAARVEEGMREGTIPRAVIVAPDGDLGFWTNWYDGSRSYEDWVVDEVMPRVARRHHTLGCPVGCHLIGVSMGAEGALRIALHRPGTFASVSSISGPAMSTDRRIEFMNDRLISAIVPTHHVFGPTEPRARIEADDPFVRWTGPESLGGMRVFLAWGTRDRDAVREGGEALHAHLEAARVPHHARVYEGEHAWRDWAAVIEEALRVQLGPPSIPAATTTAAPR